MRKKYWNVLLLKYEKKYWNLIKSTTCTAKIWEKSNEMC